MYTEKTFSRLNQYNPQIAKFPHRRDINLLETVVDVNSGWCKPWLEHGHLALTGRETENLPLQSVCKPWPEEMTIISRKVKSKRKIKEHNEAIPSVVPAKGFPIDQGTWIKSYLRTILFIITRLICTMLRSIVWKLHVSIVWVYSFPIDVLVVYIKVQLLQYELDRLTAKPLVCLLFSYHALAHGRPHCVLAEEPQLTLAVKIIGPE